MLKGKVISRGERETWVFDRGAIDLEVERFFKDKKPVSSEAAAILRGLDPETLFEQEFRRVLDNEKFMLNEAAAIWRGFDPKSRFNKLDAATANRFNRLGD
jgi:hypothetical protein